MQKIAACSTVFVLQAFFDEKVDNDAYLFGRFIIACQIKKVRTGSEVSWQDRSNPSTLHFCKVLNYYIFFCRYRQGKNGAGKGKILFTLVKCREIGRTLTLVRKGFFIGRRSKDDLDVTMLQ